MKAIFFSAFDKNNCLHHGSTLLQALFWLVEFGGNDSQVVQPLQVVPSLQQGGLENDHPEVVRFVE